MQFHKTYLLIAVVCMHYGHAGAVMSVFSSLCSTFPLSAYYHGLFIHGSAENIRRFTIMDVAQLVVLAAVQFLIYDTERTVPDFYIGSLRLDDAGNGMLLRL